MLGLEGVSKRSLSESKKKSKELDSVAKLHIYMCVRLCSMGLYRAVARIKASVQTLVQSAGTGAQPFTQQYDKLWGVRVTQRVALRPLISRGYRGAIDIKWSKPQANQLSQERLLRKQLIKQQQQTKWEVMGFVVTQSVVQMGS